MLTSDGLGTLPQYTTNSEPNNSYRDGDTLVDVDMLEFNRRVTIRESDWKFAV